MTKWVLGTENGEYFLSKNRSLTTQEITLVKRVTDALVMTNDDECGHFIHETGLNLYKLKLEHIDHDSPMLDPDSRYAESAAVLAFDRGSQRYYMGGYGDGTDEKGTPVEGFELTSNFNGAELLKMAWIKDMAQRMGLEIYMIRIE